MIGGGVQLHQEPVLRPVRPVRPAARVTSYLNVNDSVTITENLLSGPGQTNVTPGTRFLVRDRFTANNNFNGVNVGLRRRRSGGATGTSASAGRGGPRGEQPDGDGGRPDGHHPAERRHPAVRSAGGLLAQPSNIGRYSRDQFAVMPWVGCPDRRAQLTERVRAYVGYDFFALTNTVRAGDQIDLRVNPTQIPPRTNGVTGAALPGPAGAAGHHLLGPGRPGRVGSAVLTNRPYNDDTAGRWTLHESAGRWRYPPRYETVYRFLGTRDYRSCATSSPPAGGT